MRFKVFYRLTEGGNLCWEHYQAPDAETAAKNFAALAREIGQPIIIVRVEVAQ